MREDEATPSDDRSFPEISPQEFLASVRRAIGPPGAGQAPPHPERGPNSDEQRRRVEQIKERTADQRPALTEQAARMASVMGWQVWRADGREEARQLVLRLAADLGASHVALSAHPLLEELAIAGHLAQAGSMVTVAAGDNGARERLQQALAAADLGITGADYLLAETGSTVLLPRRRISRLVHLLPAVHLAIAEASQIVATLDDLLAIRTLAFLEDNEPFGHMAVISGPSRTADI